MADLSLKRLLHMAALSAIHCPGELMEYYQRKVGEGKNKMSVLNAVRNKLISRVYACVSQDRDYQKKCVPVLV
jgi:transposase